LCHLVDVLKKQFCIVNTLFYWGYWPSTYTRNILNECCKRFRRDRLRQGFDQTIHKTKHCFMCFPFLFLISLLPKSNVLLVHSNRYVLSLPATATAMAGGAPAPVVQLFRSNITRVRDPTPSRVCVYFRQWIWPILHT